MSRHLPKGFLATGLDPFNRGRQPARPPTRISSTQFPDPTSSGLGNFQFGFEANRPGPEFSDTGLRQRLRPATFDELRERFGQNLFQNFGAIARGEEGLVRRRDPITGQPIERGRGQRNVSAGGTFNPYQTVPSFNIDISQIRNSLNQQAGAQRQNLAAGAGNRRDPRFGGAQTAAINQSFGASFGAQAAANTNLISDVQRANIQTRLTGVQGQQDILNLFQKEAGQRADIGIRRGGLKIGRERIRLDKEGQDLRAALEKRRLGILSFTARERAVMDRYDAYLRAKELQEKIRRGFYKPRGSGGGILGGLGKVLGGAIGAVTSLLGGNRSDDDDDFNTPEDNNGEGYEYY